jgi:hypothetical protein
MRRRPKLTLAERRKRAAHNERTGHKPGRAPVTVDTDHARYFRYRNLVVRVRGEQIAVVRMPNRLRLPFPAVGHARSYAPLPRKYRDQIRAAAEEAERQAKAKDLGLQLPDKPVWSTPSVVAR